MNQRKAEKKEGDKWVPIKMKDVKKGDLIQIFELDGTIDPLTKHGILATSDAFEEGDKHWKFHADMTCNQKLREGKSND